MTTKSIALAIAALILVSFGGWALFAKNGDTTNPLENAKNMSTTTGIKVEEDETVKTPVNSKTSTHFNEKSVLSFGCQEGGVSLFVNGFLVNSIEDKGNSVSRMFHLIKPGENTFELVPSNSGNNATLKVLDMSADDATSMTAPTLLALSTKDTPGSSITGKLTMEDETLKFAWHEATAVQNEAESADEIYLELEALAKALEGGMDEDLIALLALKHEEIANSAGFPKANMDSGLLEGLVTRRENPEFAINLVSREDFFPLVSTNGTIVNAMRADGSHAIKIMDGINDSEFSVSLAKIEGEFVIVR